MVILTVGFDLADSAIALHWGIRPPGNLENLRD